MRERGREGGRKGGRESCGLDEGTDLDNGLIPCIHF